MNKKFVNDIKKAFWKDLVFWTLEEYEVDIQTVHSWSYVMDKILWWGIAAWHLIQLRWNAGYWKTTIASVMMKAAQDRWDAVAFIDFENTYNQEHAKNMWIDISKVIYAQPADWDSWFWLVTKLIESWEVWMIVIDSIPFARPRRELDWEIWDANMWTHAKLVTNAVNRRTPLMKKNKCTVVAINQRRDSMDAYSWWYAPWWKTLEHGCVQILRFTKPEKIEVNKKQTWFVAKMTLDKSKLKKSVTKCEVRVDFDWWVNRVKDIIETWILFWIIERKWAYYTFWDTTVQWKDSLAKVGDLIIMEIETKIKEMI